MQRRNALIGIGMLGGLRAASHAQFKVDIAGVGLVQLPVGLTAFRGEGSLSVKLSDVVSADLERSGQMRIIALTPGPDETSPADTAAWRQRGADYVLQGSVSRLANGQVDLRCKLWDAVRSVELLSLTVTGRGNELRLLAHRVADAVYEKLTGVRGVFSTRITYVTKTQGRYNLWVADADGENAVAPLSAPEPIISPSWSPGGAQLAYVSFESRKPVIYVQELTTGLRRVVANFKGSNSAPAWSPDGNTMAVTLSRDGGSHLYLIDAKGGTPRPVARSYGIDTEPVFSPDGASLYFVSDRGGSPQIYKLSLSSGEVQRVSFVGNYNISPAISPDGRWMAFISRINAQFKLHVMDLGNGNISAITQSTYDESPSFAPNGRLILYATRVQGREVLMTTTIDGQIKSTLAGSFAAIREPDWGPYQSARTNP